MQMFMWKLNLKNIVYNEWEKQPRNNGRKISYEIASEEFCKISRIFSPFTNAQIFQYAIYNLGMTINCTIELFLKYIM